MLKNYTGIAKIFLLCLFLGSILVFFYFSYSINENVLRGPPSQGTYKSFTTKHDGLVRSYDVYVPSTLLANAPAIFAFHGSYGKSDQMRWISGYDFEYLAEEKGFIVVYPQGYKNFWNDCRASADYLSNIEDVDDVGFFKKLVKIVEKDFKVNSSKIIATGISNGGHMVYKLALEAPGEVFITAPLVASLPVQENSDCRASNQAVHMMIFNGTNDPINPYDGGLVKVLGNSSRGAVMSSEDTYRYWANLAKSTSEEVFNFEERDGNDITSVYRKQSIGTKVVALYTLVNSGHVVATQYATLGDDYGGNAGDVSAANEIFSLYEELSR